MKKIYPLSIAFALLFSFIFLSNSGGFATIRSEDATGSPLSNRTCSAGGCHNSNAFNVSLSISIKDEAGQEVSDYVGGQTYEVSFTNDASPNPNGYGFQMVSLIDSDNSGVNTWTPKTGSTTSKTVNGVEYVEQSGIMSDNTVVFDWVAPPENSGPVTFYASGNAVNGNGGRTGDGARNISLTLEEGFILNVDSPIEQAFSYYPNPARHSVTVDLDGIYTTGSIAIYDLTGTKIKNQDFSGSETEIDISDLTDGFYVLRLSDLDGSTLVTRKLVKN